MLKMTWFETEEDLQKLTGLNHDQLWDAGFDLDDWDFGFRVTKKIHTTVERDQNDSNSEDYYREEIEADWDKEGYWLLSRMQNCCCGAKHVKLGRYHYYLCYHS